MIVRLDGTFFYAEVGAPALDRASRAAQHIRKLGVAVSVLSQQHFQPRIFVRRP